MDICWHPRAHSGRRARRMESVEPGDREEFPGSSIRRRSVLAETVARRSSNR